MTKETTEPSAEEIAKLEADLPENVEAGTEQRESAEKEIDDTGRAVKVEERGEDHRREPSDFERLLHFLANLTGTDADTVLVSAVALLMKTHRIDFEEKFIFGVYVAGVDDVLVKEDDDGKHYITDVLGKTFVFKDSGIETKSLRAAIKFARTWMDTTGRIAVVYNDGKFYRVLVEEYDLIRDISLTAKIERLYAVKPSH